MLAALVTRCPSALVFFSLFISFAEDSMMGEAR